MYLFPFEKILPSSRILIYGAGDVGQEYLKQITVTGYCEILGFVDQAFDKYPAMIVPIYAPDKIMCLKFDFIVLAMKTGMYVKEITENLLGQGIARDKIIYVGSRTVFSIMIEKDTSRKAGSEYAFEKDCLAIALKYGPGLGDCIVKKKFFEEIVRIVPNCLIDIYAPNASYYIKSIYGNHPNLNIVVDDGGAVYAKNVSQYALSMKVFFMLQIDYVNFDRIEKWNTDFTARIRRLKQRCVEYKLTPFPPCQNKLHFDRMKFIGANYYTSFNYQDVFAVSDTVTAIPLIAEVEKEFSRLYLGRYITINYGNGSAVQKTATVAKQWPLIYFQEFVGKFKTKYPLINVVQLGAKNAVKVKEVDKYILGESLELSKYVLKNAIFHLDIEGGLVHLATQLGTKCIVLFGPTPVHFFGYTQNINIVSEKCSGCYCLYDDINHCARNLEEPECMYSITPEMVMEAAKYFIL